MRCLLLSMFARVPYNCGFVAPSQRTKTVEILIISNDAIIDNKEEETFNNSIETTSSLLS